MSNLNSRHYSGIFALQHAYLKTQVNTALKIKTYFWKYSRLYEGTCAHYGRGKTEALFTGGFHSSHPVGSDKTGVWCYNEERQNNVIKYLEKMGFRFVTQPY